jgi:HK97 gp10 family phage protein
VKFEPDAASLAALRRQLEVELPRDVRKLGRDATLELLRKGRTKMRAEALKRTGLLRRAIFVKLFRSKKGQPEGGDIRIHTGLRAQKKGRDAFYWRFLDKGTKHLRAQHFVATTLNYVRSIQPQIYRDKFERPLVALWNSRRKKVANV